MYIYQHTIKNPISASGIGLHNNKKVKITLRPAPEETGVIFRRIDFDPCIDIPAAPGFVGDTLLCTSLEKDNASVSTIEHLMSALSGMGIDNVIVDIDAPEVPILDGSSSLFIFLIQSAGIQQQQARKKFVRILETVEVKGHNNSWVKLEPYDGFKLSFFIDFDHPRAKALNFSVDFSATSYVKLMARARTFGFEKDIDDLRKNQRVLGTSLNNVIILDDDGVLNDGGLRFEDELVRHKVLDVVGDLFVLKHQIIGHFYGYKSGHFLNNMLLRKVLQTPTAWETVSFNEESQLPINFIQSKVS